jgi:signal transduction histidine kinase
MGIGLSVCRRLVRAIGGTCWAAPREGGGSEFGFAIPLYDADVD